MYGPGHSVGQIRQKNKYRIAYNIESSKDLMGGLVSSVENEHDAVYFPQDIGTFEMMLWGIEKHKAGRDERLPLRMSHRQFQTGTAEFHLDPHTWINRMKEFDLSFGPRIHGNVIPILAGVPSVVFAHDSRTLELAEYHEIPHFSPEEVAGVVSLEDVVARADFTKFNAGHAERFEKLQGFLKENGISTIYDSGQAEARDKYERTLSRVDFPPPQRTEWANMTSTQSERLRKQRNTELDVSAQSKEIAALQKRMKEQSEAFKRLGSIGN